MNPRKLAALPGLLAAAFLVVSCNDGVSPGTPEFGWIHHPLPPPPPPPPPPPTRPREILVFVQPGAADARLMCDASVGEDVFTAEVTVQFVDDPETLEFDPVVDVDYAGQVVLTIEDDASLLGNARLCGPPGGTDALMAFASGGVVTFTFGIDQPSTPDPADPFSLTRNYTLRASAEPELVGISNGVCVSLAGVGCDV